MHKSNLIVALKANNKVLREIKDTSYIPFGSQYSILIKNMDSRRASVRLWIDGTDATEGTSLVVNGNSEVEIERFIKNGNLKEGNRFKFIEKTANIEKHRGSKVDDGFIRVEFQFEKIYEPINTWDAYYRTPSIYSTQTILHSNNEGSIYKGSPAPTAVAGSGVMRSMSISSNNATMSNATASVASANVNNVFTSYTSNAATAQSTEATLTTSNAVNDAGITVPGGHSTQQFTTASWFPVEVTKHVILLKLLGESPEGKKVQAPITVKAKPRCDTCGKLNKATSKFCSECGTSLILF
jgi:hypothetical protein